MAVDGGSADSGDAGSDGGTEGGAEQAGSQSGADPIANLGPDGAAETAGPAPDQPVGRTHDPMGDLTDPAADGGFDGSVFEQPPPVDPDGEPAWLLPTEYAGARGSAISTLPPIWPPWRRSPIRTRAPRTSPTSTTSVAWPDQGVSA